MLPYFFVNSTPGIGLVSGGLFIISEIHKYFEDGVIGMSKFYNLGYSYFKDGNDAIEFLHDKSKKDKVITWGLHSRPGGKIVVVEADYTRYTVADMRERYAEVCGHANDMATAYMPLPVLCGEEVFKRAVDATVNSNQPVLVIVDDKTYLVTFNIRPSQMVDEMKQLVECLGLEESAAKALSSASIFQKA